MLEAAVATSREWDAYNAGVDVAQKTLAKLKHRPKFFLLFATIHYEKNGGFQKLLDGVYSQLPKDVLLVGGSVAGFMTSAGCCSRGVAAMAVHSEDLDAAVAVGHNTKLNPMASAKDCAKMLKAALSLSKYSKRYFTTFISSSTVPPIPVIGSKKVVRRFPGIDLVSGLISIAAQLLQIGPGRDDTVFKKFSEDLQGWEGLGGGTCDSLKLEKNVQFLNHDVIRNSIVSLGVSTTRDFRIRTFVEMKPTDKHFTATSVSAGGCMLSKINSKPAVSEYLRTMGWSSDVLDERLYRKVFYYPFLDSKQAAPEPRMFGLIYGETFVCPSQVEKGIEYTIWTSNAADLIKSASELANTEIGEAVFMVSCGTRLETMGSATSRVTEILKKRFSDKFLVIYTAGEYASTAGSRPVCMYQSENALVMA